MFLLYLIRKQLQIQSIMVRCFCLYGVCFGPEWLVLSECDAPHVFAESFVFGQREGSILYGRG